MNFRKLAVFVTFFAVFALILSGAADARRLWNKKKKQEAAPEKKTEEAINPEEEDISVSPLAAPCTEQDEKEAIIYNKALEAFEEALVPLSKDLNVPTGEVDRILSFLEDEEYSKKMAELLIRCPQFISQVSE